MVLQRLLVQERTGIRRRKGNLYRVRIDLDRETDGFLDRLLGLARKTQNEGTVRDDAKLAAVFGKTLGHVDAHPLLDVVKKLLIAGFVAEEQEPQAVVLQHLH